MAGVVETNDLNDLVGSRLLWDALLAETPHASFFHTFDWLNVYWQHFGHDQQLRVLIVHAADQPVGILPLCVRVQRHRLGAVRVLTYPLDDWGTCYGPIGPNPAATMIAGLNHIRYTRRDWDTIDLPWVAGESGVAGRPERAMRIAGLFSRREPYQTLSLVDLDDGWEGFLATKSSKQRHEFRRILRRAFEDGQLRYIRHRPDPAREGDGDPRWDLYAMCQHVALASWQADVTDGNTITHGRVRRFLQDVHAVAARLGMVDVNLLLADERPVAFCYNYHWHQRLVGLRMGFDRSLGNRSLGTALLLRLLEDSARRGDESFNLGPGEEPFKRRLSTRAETTYRLTYTPLGSWRSQLVRMAHWGSERWRRSWREHARPRSA